MGNTISNSLTAFQLVRYLDIFKRGGIAALIRRCSRMEFKKNPVGSYATRNVVPGCGPALVDRVNTTHKAYITDDV